MNMSKIDLITPCLQNVYCLLHFATYTNSQYHRISRACSMCTYLLDLAQGPVAVTISQAALCAYPNMLRKELRLSQRQLAAKEMSCFVSLVHSYGCQAEAHLSNELLSEHELVIRFRWLGKVNNWIFKGLIIWWFATLQEAELGDMKHLQEAFGFGCLPWEIKYLSKIAYRLADERDQVLSLWASFQRHFHWRLLLGLFPLPLAEGQS